MSKQLDPPVVLNRHLLRRSAETLLRDRNSLPHSGLPHLRRAAFKPNPSGSASDWTIQIHAENLTSGSLQDWKVHVSASDDRDFRRMDGPSVVDGPVCRSLRSLGQCYPGLLGEERYYPPNGIPGQLGKNVIDETGFNDERTSGYHSTSPWEDRFFTVTPKSLVNQGNGFFRLTFDAPPDFPANAGVNAIIACIVERRVVGAIGDTEWDDVVFTETAFANDAPTVFPYGNTEALPGSSNLNAELAAVLPIRAQQRDYIYLVGKDFFIRDTSGAASGIVNVEFDPNSGGPSRFQSPAAGKDDPILLIGSRVIRCKIPEDLDPGLSTIRISFQGGTVASKFNAIWIDAD